MIEELCEKGLSMVMFDFIGLTQEQSRKLIYEIRQGVFNYSSNKNFRVPYSLTLVLDLGGSRILTGTIMNMKVCLIIKYKIIFIQQLVVKMKKIV